MGLTDTEGTPMLGSVGIRVLGPTAVDESQSLSPRDRAVLGALVVDRGGVTAPDRLAEAVWGEAVPDSWRKVVQSSIVRLRRVLGSTAIETTSDGYRLTLEADEVDAWRFERLLATAQSLAQLGEPDRVAYTLEGALGLWQGEPLQDLDRWPPASAEVSRLHDLRRTSEELHTEALLDVGEHEQVIPNARSLAAAEPLRERRWELLALALYRSGRQAEALRALADARRTLRDELGIEPRAEFVALEQAILDHDPALTTPFARGVVSARCPYKGLEAYDVDDADWFFGREALVQACRRRLAQAGALVVTGGSGSGKSSLVHAGLVPRLCAEGRAVALCTPGADPSAAVTAALSVTGRDAVLVVDQAEELFTLCPDVSKRIEFAATVADHAARQPVVLVLRADHIASTAAHRELSRMVEAGLFLVGPMNESELRDVIVEPARLAGCRLESGLVHLLIRDVFDEPGALPLLSHALVETWTRREGSVLTVAGYRDAGGVRGAVARTAERLYEVLPDSQRVLARALFLRLVETTQNDVVRHPISMQALGEVPEQRAVVDLLLAARLITVGQDTLEIAHEALARAWPRLRGWLEEDREGQRIRQHLSAAATGWDALGRDQSELYRGARLHTALDWAGAAGESLTPLERAFLDAAAEHEQSEEDALRVQAAAQARSNRRLRRSLTGLVVLLVCALIAGALAVSQSARAANERDRAAASSRRTAVQNLVSQSTRLRDTQRDLAALLAVAGYRLAPGAGTESALFATFTGSPGFAGHLRGDKAPFRSGAFLPDGHRLAIIDAVGMLRLFDAVRFREVDRVAVFERHVLDALIAVSRDSSTLAVATDTGDNNAPGELRLLDPATMRPRSDAVRLDFPARALAVSPDGRLAAVSGGANGRVEIFDARTGAMVARAEPGQETTSASSLTPVPALAFLAPDRLVVASKAGSVQTLDARTGNTLATIGGPPDLTGQKYEGDRGQAARVVLLTADGRSAVTSGPAGTMRWNLEAGGPTWKSPSQSCRTFALVEALGSVICGVGAGRIVTLDFETGVTRAEQYRGSAGLVNDVAVSADGRVLALIAGGDLTRPLEGDARAAAAIWRMDGTGPIQRRFGSGPLVTSGYSPDGHHLLVAAAPPDDAGASRQAPLLLRALTSRDVDIKVMNADTGAIVDELDSMVVATWSGRGDELAGICTDGTGCAYDLARHARRSGGVEGPAFIPMGSIADPAHRRVIVWDAAGHVRGLDPASGSTTPPSFDLPATSPQWWAAWGLGMSPDGRTLVGASFEHGLQSFDMSGKRIAGPRPEYGQFVMSPQGEVVTWTRDGHIDVLDPGTLEARADRFPASFGDILNLWFTADGRQMVVTSSDRTYQLVDWPSRTPLGDPIAWEAGVPSPWSYPDLRADGKQLVLPGANGVTAWNLDRDTWVERACALAGRELTPSEWAQYLSAFGQQTRICT